MCSEPIFQDLFAYGCGSIAWVRVYLLEDGQAIALALDPVDNPGRSVVNGAEELIEGLAQAFPSVEGIRLMVRFPGDPRGEGWTEIVFDGDGPEFERRTIEEVQTLVGEELFDPEPDYATCADLGGEGHPLLDLIPPPEPGRNPIQDLALVAVADLPWPHNPSKCASKQRFDDLAELYGSSRRHCTAVGAHWSYSLDETDYEACPYHQADWRRIADVSVEVFEGLAEDAELDVVIEAVDRILGNTAEGAWCRSLFSDPIVWSPEQDSVTDGQHRSCALRASGAPFCVVDVDGAYVAEPVAADPRRRAAAAVSAYWAQRAAD